MTQVDAVLSHGWLPWIVHWAWSWWNCLVPLPILAGNGTYAIFCTNFILDRSKETTTVGSYIVAAQLHANAVEWALHYSLGLKMGSISHFESWPSRLCSVMFLKSHATVQAISHQLTTTVIKVVRSCGIYGGQSDTGAVFLQVLLYTHCPTVINHHKMTLATILTGGGGGASQYTP
jgi:hypothetical protein